MAYDALRTILPIAGRPGSACRWTAVKETRGIGVLGHFDLDIVALGRAELFEELGIAVSAQPLASSSLRR